MVCAEKYVLLPLESIREANTSVGDIVAPETSETVL
jgi:hypothetical protein